MKKRFVTITQLCEAIEKRVQNKFDLVIFVEGKRGMGKSTFLWVLGKRLNKRGVVTFKPRKHLVFSRDKSIETLAMSKKTFIMNDELINVAYNRDFYEQDQKILLKALNNYRDSCNIFAGCVPKFRDLDTQIQKLCEMRVQIHRRGIAEIHGQLKGFYLDDPWNTKDNIKKELKLIHRAKGKLKTQRFFVKFPNLREKARKFYDDLKHERRNKVFMGDKEQEENPLDSFHAKLYESLTSGKLTKPLLENLCQVTGYKIRTARDMLNRRLKDNSVEQTLQTILKDNEDRINKKEHEKKVKSHTIHIGTNDSEQKLGTTFNQNEEKKGELGTTFEENPSNMLHSSNNNEDWQDL